MKKFYSEIKFVPQAPKTYEVRYLEVKDQSNLSKFANCLGIGTVYNCDNGKQVSSSSSSSGTVTKADDAEKAAKVAAAVAKAMAEVAAQNKGDKVESKTDGKGETTTTYHSNKK